MKTLFLTLVLFWIAVLPGKTQVSSDFESGNTDGWVCEGDGMYYWENGTGNPGGCLRVDDDATGNTNRSFAPLKFLGDWSLTTGNDTLKADINLHRISGSYVTSTFVFRILGPGGQATGILNPTPAYDIWTTYKISLSSSDWQLNSGTWSGLLQNVTTLIITMEYINGDENVRLDNVGLSFTPVQQPVIPVVCSGFEEGGYDGWAFQGTGGISNQTTGGSPGHYIRIGNGTPAAYAFAPPKFLGNWNLIDNHAAELCFDLLITSTTGTLLLNDAFIRISGPGGIAKIPLDSNIQKAFGKWHTFAFPVSEAGWTMESGTWGLLINQVTELRICLEFTSGSETVGIDDFCISNLPPLADFSADHPYTFVGNPVQFTDLSDKVPTVWAWDFGDLNFSAQQNPVHTYSQSGLFDVTLTATNYFGSDTKQVTDYIEVAGIEECLKYADNFNAVTINPAWIIQEGTWAISAGTMRQSSNYYGTSLLDGCYAITGSQLWSDYYISADIKSADDDFIGLVFNFQDFQNMYMFLWNLQSPVRALYKWVEGVATILASDNTGYVQYTWYQVKVGGYNGNMTLTLDGQEIFNIQDATFSSGKAGLYCRGNTNSYWDNVLIECAIDDSVTLENIAISSGQNECFEATEIITVAGNGSTFIVQTGGTVRLAAGQKISLLAGTMVYPGGNLHANISTNEFFCSSPPAGIGDGDKEIISGSPDRPNIRNKYLLNVYPNPTTGKFILAMAEPEGQERILLEIYNMMGENVMKTDIPSENFHLLDLSDQPNGIYLLKVQRDNDIRITKIVRQQ